MADSSLHELGAADQRSATLGDNQYIRYHIATDKADAGYPMPIRCTWHGFPLRFTAGVDWALVWNNRFKVVNTFTMTLLAIKSMKSPPVEWTLVRTVALRSVKTGLTFAITESEQTYCSVSLLNQTMVFEQALDASQMGRVTEPARLPPSQALF